MVHRTVALRSHVFFAVAIGLVLLAWPALSGAATRGVAIKDASGREIGGYSGSYALIIGVSDYRAGWPKLESIAKEMQEIKSAVERHGFKVKLVMDPDGKALENAFDDFIDEYGYDDDNRLLFVFAGHGHTMRDGSKGYLVPVDAPDPRRDEKNFLRKSLDMTQLLAWAKQMTAKHALFLFDSCFSGTIFKTRDLPSTPPHISAITAKPVRQFITSGSAGESVPARSVFAPSLVKALRGEGDLTRDGYVTGTELGLYLREKVIHYGTGQTPQYGKIRDPYLDEGDFVFQLADGSVYQEVSPTVSTGSLRVESEPDGATLYVDGKLVGRTPRNLSGLKPGSVILRVEQDGYEPRERTVTIKPGRTVFEAFPLKRAVARKGWLYVMTDPEGARVRIMNIEPAYSRGMALEPGRYHVNVTMPGYEPFDQWVSLNAGQNLDLMARLEKKSCRLTVRPSPADAAVRLLNAPKPYRPGVELAPGSYHVEVSRPGYRTENKWIDLSSRDRTVSIQLERSPASGAVRPSVQAADSFPRIPSRADGDRGLLEQIKRRGRLVCGVKDAVIPFGYVDEKTNQIVGFDVDICRAIADRLGVALQLKPVTSATRIPMVAQGSIDIVAATMAYKPVRDEVIDFSRAYFMDGQKLLVKKGSGIRSVADLAGKKVGTSKGSTSEKRIKAAQPGCRVLSFQGYPQAFLALRQGKVAAVTTDSTILLSLKRSDPSPERYEMVGDYISCEPYGLGLQSHQSGLLEFVNRTLADLWTSGEYRKIYDKWFGRNTGFYLPLIWGMDTAN